MICDFEVYKIEQARAEDLPFLPEIELAAARLLEGEAPESVLLEATGLDEFREAQNRRHLWVARAANDHPVGFAHVEVLEPSILHLKEIDVHPQYSRRGLGTRLITELCAWAEREHFAAITLTTFRNVPWNMPFYERVGFRVLSRNELSPALVKILEGEALRGLERSRRVAMRRSLI